jgi:selenocysteine-specific elongation factor
LPPPTPCFCPQKMVLSSTGPICSGMALGTVRLFTEPWKLEDVTDRHRNMTTDKFISVGVAGHVDHGKTTLVRCLTGIDTDRLKEEKRRGLSIEPSVAPMHLPSGSLIALVDVPGHSDFLKNTIRGLSGVDMAILVVAADDGVMPQTRDHLEVLSFLKAKGGFVVLSKADQVDSETMELAEMEIREILEGSFLQGKPVIPFSAVDGRGLDQVSLALESEADHVAGKSIQAPFRLWIDQARSFPGFGTVVSGTVLSGIITRDDTVQLLPSGKETKVRFIEVHHQRVEEAVAGQRVGLNLHGVSLSEANRGTVLAAPGILRPAALLNAELSLLPVARRPMVNRQRVKLYIGTRCTPAQLVMMQKERLHAGETGLVQLRLQEPLAVLPRDPFVVSLMNRQGVIGGGKILETSKEKFRLAKAEKTLAYLQPLQSLDVKSVVNHYFSRFAGRLVTADEIASATGIPIKDIQRVMESGRRAGRLLHLEGRGYFDKRRYEALKIQLMNVTRKILLKGTFRSIASSEEIRFRLDPSLDDGPFETMLQELCHEGRLAKTDTGYRIPNLITRPSLHREKLMQRVAEFIRDQRYATFSVGTFWKRHGEGFTYKEVEKMLDYLHANQKLVRLNDGRFIDSEAMEEIQAKVKELILQKGTLSIQDSRDILGYGRTRAIPILDYLDAIGLTRRVGDERVLSAEVLLSGACERKGYHFKVSVGSTD